MSYTFTELIMEEATLDWLSNLGWIVLHGQETTQEEPAAERDTLLPKLISGHLRIKEAEQIIGNIPNE